jgi:hypothetical protein
MNKKLEHFKDKGFVVFNNYLDLKSCNNLLIDLENTINQIGSSATPPMGEQNIIQNDKIVNNIHYFSESFLNAATKGEHIDFLCMILNDPFYELIPNNLPNYLLAQCNVRKSDSALPYHFDTRLKIPSKQTWSVQGIIALGERGHKNGGLKVIPKSHLFPFQHRDELDLKNEINIDMEAGDLVLFSSSLYHATHEPTGEVETAFGITLTYRCWWCKPQFNFIDMFGLERLSKLNKQQRTLLGAYSQPSSNPFDSPSSRSGYTL